MKKTVKQLDKHIKDSFDADKERLRRTSTFVIDVKECWQKIKNTPSRRFKFKKEFFDKYGFSLPKEEHLNEPQLWLSPSYCNVVSTVSSDKEIREKFLKGESPLKLLEKRIRNDIEYYHELSKYPELKELLSFNFWKPFTLLTTILENGRFWTVRIDTDRNTEIIKRIFEKELKKIKDLKKEYKVGKSGDKSFHLRNIERYFAVWDLVQKRKQLWPYERIARKLKEKGWYNNQTIKKATILARQDYRTACKAIGVSVKDKKNVSRRVMEPIISNKIKGAKKRKEEFIEWEKRLASFGLGLDEYIPERAKRRGEDKFRHNPTDGPTKQKLKSIQKIETNVKKRANEKLGSKIRELLK